MFDLDYEFYCFSNNRLSFTETIIFSFKVFWNIFVISLLVATPIVLIQYLLKIISVN